MTTPKSRLDKLEAGGDQLRANQDMHRFVRAIELCRAKRNGEPEAAERLEALRAELDAVPPDEPRAGGGRITALTHEILEGEKRWG